MCLYFGVALGVADFFGLALGVALGDAEALALGVGLIVGISVGIGVCTTCSIGLAVGTADEISNLLRSQTKYPAITTKIKIMTTMATFRFKFKSPPLKFEHGQFQTKY